MARTATKAPARSRVATAARSTARSSTPRSRESGTSTGIRTYRAALQFLNSQTNYERMLRVGYNTTNFNLARMLRILQALGNPHKTVTCIHIAGTKGKGSTCTMLASMLTAAGFKTGLYTSPHLLDMRERIQIGRDVISEAEFTRLIAKIAPIINRMKREEPTFFEIITAVAFLHFAKQKVDFAVIETGMGGRLDSTNVIKPLVCGITSISYDHVQQLGHTLEQIAQEKAGIFKAGVPVISAPQVTAVRRVLRRAAEQTGCELKFIGDDIEYSYRFESSRITGPQTRVCMTTPNSRFDHLHVPLLGEHQAHNCGVALGILDVLRQRGFEVTEQAAIDGLSRVRIEGRVEIVREQPKLVMDVAHNAASVAALMRAIGQNVPYDSMVVIFGCSADKDVDGMLTQLDLGADKVIFTNNPSSRSADPHELLIRFQEKSGKMAQIAPTLEEAYRIAKSCTTREDLVCITGSFYLVGEAKRLFAEGKLE